MGGRATAETLAVCHRKMRANMVASPFGHLAIHFSAPRSASAIRPCRTEPRFSSASEDSGLTWSPAPFRSLTPEVKGKLVREIASFRSALDVYLDEKQELCVLNSGDFYRTLGSAR